MYATGRRSRHGGVVKEVAAGERDVALDGREVAIHIGIEGGRSEDGIAAEADVGGRDAEVELLGGEVVRAGVGGDRAIGQQDVVGSAAAQLDGRCVDGHVTEAVEVAEGGGVVDVDVEVAEGGELFVFAHDEAAGIGLEGHVAIGRDDGGGGGNGAAAGGIGEDVTECVDQFTADNDEAIGVHFEGGEGRGCADVVAEVNIAVGRANGQGVLAVGGALQGDEIAAGKQRIVAEGDGVFVHLLAGGFDQAAIDL